MAILLRVRYHMHVNGAAIKARLLARARELGCVAVGVTNAGPLADHARFLAWLARGGAASMGYLERTASLRADPRLLLETARSVVVVALGYPSRPGLTPGSSPKKASPEDLAPGPHPTHGSLAALFGGRDYHAVLKKLLSATAEPLQSSGSTWRAFVDTGPVLERSLAVAAGLGVVGKHTQLLVPGHGARVVLGVLLTEVPMEPDPPLDWDPCDGCDACVKACPTGALGKGGSVDAKRCLSYWTTASREPIPHELRIPLSNRLYGCDTCQEACPLDPQEGRTPPPHQGLAGNLCRTPEELHLLLARSARELDGALRDTAMAWIGRRSLLRTACVVLGNMGQERSIEPLERALEDADPTVRSHAAWALNQIRKKQGTTFGSSTSRDTGK